MPAQTRTDGLQGAELVGLAARRVIRSGTLDENEVTV